MSKLFDIHQLVVDKDTKRDMRKIQKKKDRLTYKLDFFTIEHAVNKFKETSKAIRIRNPIVYLKVCIYNSINEMTVDIDSKLRYEGVIDWWMNLFMNQKWYINCICCRTILNGEEKFTIIYI